MSKTIVKTENRQRVQANLVSFTDNGNGTAVVSDVPANVNVEGTRLDENLINGIQQGLVFTVDATLSANAGYDLYTLGLVGMAGADNANGFPIFEGLSLNFKALATNTQNVVKLALSGTEYDLVKIQNGSVVNMIAGEIINGNYYNVIFDGVRFNISLSNLQSYGTTTGTALEGNQLGKILGVESSKIGGLISTTGTKTAGNVYYDTLTESYYICNVTNNQNFIDLVNFTPISNTDLSTNIQKMIAYRTENPTLVGDRGSSTNGIQLIKKGNLKIINFLNVPIANNQANESYTIPDWFFENVPTGVYACVGSDYIQTTPAEIFLRTATKKLEFNNANFVAGRTYSGQLIVVEN